MSYIPLNKYVIGAILGSFITFSIMIGQIENLKTDNNHLQNEICISNESLDSQLSDILALSENVHVLTEDNFKRVVSDLNFKFPNIIYKQSRWESGAFTYHPSDLLLNNNNLFGMRHPKSRLTTSKGADKNGYAIYESWQASVVDRWIYDSAVIKTKNKNREQYLNFLNRVYSTTENYSEWLR